jgi:alpha-N-arabinofuranosidase
VINADIASTSGDFTGKAEASLINSDDLKAPFTFDKQSQYLPVIKDVKFTGNKLSFTFPPHSFTQIRAGMK